MHLHSTTRLSIAIGLATASCVANAQWSSVDIHPVGATYSVAWDQGVGGTSGGVRDLSTDGFGNVITGRALLWQTNVGIFDLTPAAAGGGIIWANDGSTQGGQVRINGKSVAAMWTGTVGTFVNLGSRSTSDSVVFGVYPGSQVGFGTSAKTGIAGAYLWHGTAKSAVGLNPTGWDEGSIAYDVFGNTQVGTAARQSFIGAHACYWQGSKNSFVDIHPAGFEGSFADCIYGSTIGGQAYNVDPFTGVRSNHSAMLWNLAGGTPLNLNPPGGYTSQIDDVAPGAACGRVTDSSGVTHAYYWNLYTMVNIDLHTVLAPGVYSRSTAHGVITNGNHIEICGNATDIATGQTHAIRWTFDPPA